jgi:uncharacterized membrane protein YphA (DoxX/SURF4 family)
MNFTEYEKYNPLILRVSIAFLWIWMAVVPKLIFPEPRVMMVSKSWTAVFMPVSPKTFIFLLAIAELILGIMLLIGLFTRIVSATQIVLTIIFVIGLWNIAVAQGLTSPLAHLFFKDIPLIAGNIVLVITGGGIYSLDNKRDKS